MAILELLKGLVRSVDPEPNTYHCSDCGRTFEVDDPPRRAVCSDCGSSAVEVVSG